MFLTDPDRLPVYSRPGCTMDDLEHDLLSYLQTGRSVFRPADSSTEPSTPSARQSVSCSGGVTRGYVDFPDSRISKTEQGTYLAVGAVNLTA